MIFFVLNDKEIGFEFHDQDDIIISIISNDDESKMYCIIIEPYMFGVVGYCVLEGWALMSLQTAVHNLCKERNIKYSFLRNIDQWKSKFHLEDKYLEHFLYCRNNEDGSMKIVFLNYLKNYFADDINFGDVFYYRLNSTYTAIIIDEPLRMILISLCYAGFRDLEIDFLRHQAEIEIL